MRARQMRAPLFVLILVLSLGFAGCFGGKGGGGGGGNGGGGGGANNSPLFAIAVADSGNFQQGQKKATYTIDVTNIGQVATSGNVQVTVTLPAGESFVSISGSGGAQGWTFPGGPVATRADSLAPGASWPILTITVDVSLTATSPQVLMASITGGGAANASNQDSTSIFTHVSILFGRYAFFLSGFDSSGALSIAGSINVDQNGNVMTGEEDFKDPSVVHPAQAVTGFCQNAQVPAGFCKLTAGGKTSQYDFVLRNNNTVARFFEDPADPLSTGSGSGVLISQVVPSSNALTSPSGFNGYFSIEFSGTDTALTRIGVEGNIFTDLTGAITPGANNSSQADVNDNGTLIAPSGTTRNVTGNFSPTTVDANGRATMIMTIGAQTLNLALYILAPQVPTTGQSGRAFAIDITQIATSKQVLSGQFNWLGNTGLGNSTPVFTSSSISGANVFGLWGVAAGAPTKSNTSIGILDATKKTLLFDTNNAGTVNGGGAAPAPPLNGAVNSITVAPNGRAVLTTTVGGVIFTYVLYLDDPVNGNDGNMMGTSVNGGADTTVSFGFFTGQNPTNTFNNVGGTYVLGTVTPVLAGVLNGVSAVAISQPTLNGSTYSGTFTSSTASGNYSFDAATGRGTAISSVAQKLFGNTNAVFYIITPNLMIMMGADQNNVAPDFIAFQQF